MTSLLQFSSSGKGPARRRHPATRLFCGLIMVVICATLPLQRTGDLIPFLLFVCAWLLWCGTPYRVCLASSRLALLLFLPLLLFVLPNMHTQTYTEALRQPLHLILRCSATLFVCIATCSAISPSEINAAISDLPFPHTCKVLLLQLINQSILQAHESHRLVTALRVRGVPTSRLMIRLSCLKALPVIWLLRLSLRAERVSDAMRIRGFPDSHVATRQTAWNRGDLAVAALVTALLILLSIINGSARV